MSEEKSQEQNIASEAPENNKDWTDMISEKGELDKSVERKIKKALSKRDGREKPNTFIVYYYGCYNGYYAILADNENWAYPAVIIEGFDIIGGIRFKKGFCEFELWKK